MLAQQFPVVDAKKINLSNFQVEKLQSPVILIPSKLAAKVPPTLMPWTITESMTRLQDMMEKRMGRSSTYWDIFFDIGFDMF